MFWRFFFFKPGPPGLSDAFVWSPEIQAFSPQAASSLRGASQQVPQTEPLINWQKLAPFALCVTDTISFPSWVWRFCKRSSLSWLHMKCMITVHMHTSHIYRQPKIHHEGKLVEEIRKPNIKKRCWASKQTPPLTHYWSKSHILCLLDNWLHILRFWATYTGVFQSYVCMHCFHIKTNSYNFLPVLVICTSCGNHMGEKQFGRNWVKQGYCTVVAYGMYHNCINALLKSNIGK